MRKLILVANWKNYPASIEEAEGLLKEMAKKRELYKKLALFIAPPLPYLETVLRKAGGFAKLGAQDVSLAGKGNHTGEVTPEILKNLGVRLLITGHSERRALGESSETASRKTKMALRAGIVPLVCVGEQERDKDGEHFEHLREEIKATLSGIPKQAAASLIMAYEPVWVIGKSAKDALPPAEVAQSVVFIRKILVDLYGRSVAEKIPIIYGGSVEPTNAEILARETGVAGFLVGHASLKAKWLEEIANSMTQK